MLNNQSGLLTAQYQRWLLDPDVYTRTSRLFWKIMGAFTANQPWPIRHALNYSTVITL